MRLLPLLAVAAVLTSACAQTRKAPETITTQTSDTKAAEPVIVFQRTPCFGTCPDYDATVYPDGRVTLVGRQHVASIGTYEVRVSKATVDKILADAHQLGFAQLREHYSPGEISDLPSTILSIRQADGTLKTVQVEGQTPPGLKPLLDYVGTEMDKLAQQGADR